MGRQNSLSSNGCNEKRNESDREEALHGVGFCRIDKVAGTRFAVSRAPSDSHDWTKAIRIDPVQQIEKRGVGLGNEGRDNGKPSAGQVWWVACIVHKF
jgi:hypothetical protein